MYDLQGAKTRARAHTQAQTHNTHTHTHTHTNARTYTHTHARVQKLTHACSIAHPHSHSCTHSYTYTHAGRHKLTHARSIAHPNSHSCTHSYTYMHAGRHKLMHARSITHPNSHSCTHTHTCMTITCRQTCVRAHTYTQIHLDAYMHIHTYIGLARTIHIRCIYRISGRQITKYTVIYSVYIRFWPTLHVHTCMHAYTRTPPLTRIHTCCVRTQVPIALVSLVDKDRQFFKSHQVGLALSVRFLNPLPNFKKRQPLFLCYASLTSTCARSQGVPGNFTDRKSSFCAW